MICGIDVGTLNTPAYVAWLRDEEFFLDMYFPTKKKPMPDFPSWVHVSAFLAFDARQCFPANAP